MSNISNISKLLDLMKFLRSPDGCPWDKVQSFKTIAPHTIEEAYEVVDTIERENHDDLKDELGDLLYQIIFYCQMASEKNLFKFDDVVEGLYNKLSDRHSDIINNINNSHDLSVKAHNKIWEQNKILKRTSSSSISQNSKNNPASISNNQVLSGIALNLPALSMAQKLQKRAAAVGFDWNNITLVFNKLKEEIVELEAEINKDHTSVLAQEELGDILFCCVNLARHLGKDAENIMRDANNKFKSRFEYVEVQVLKSGKPWDKYTLDELESFWVESKEQ